MKPWQKFELDSENYLKEKFGKYATFELRGGSDSTVRDILVTNQNGENYYIEAKLCPAQCGQFVLLPDIKSSAFMFSKKNKTDVNDYVKAIIEYMNDDFEAFKEAGTTGKEISFNNDQSVFAGWIKDNYHKKGTKFIITNDFSILKLDDFDKVFKVEAKYRIKRSGSSDVGSKYISKVSNYLKDNFTINNIETKNGKLFVTSDKELDKQRFIIDKYEFMISKRESNYEIRKLSNTFNANVIFSIDLKPGFIYLNDIQFENLL